jgi:hypothetical protein
VPKIDQILAQVERLVETVKPQEAEDRLLSLIGAMGEEELRVWEADLRLTIGRFLPKRRKGLLLTLDGRLSETNGAPGGGLNPPAADPQLGVDVVSLRSELEEKLRFLSDRHIYQWSTFYRDALSIFFDRFLAAAADEAAREEALQAVREPIVLHAGEIWGKGFQYLTSHVHETPDHAVRKSVGGLQRFLDLPIEFFSAKDAGVGPVEARALRAVCSAMLGGILEGFALARFGDFSGGEILSRYPRSWAHSLAFLIDDDLERLLNLIEPGDFRDGISRSVRPLIQALDELGTRVGDYVPLTALAQMNWESRRLDASIQPPPYSAEPQLIEIQCYLDPSFVARRELDEAANRNVGVVVAPLRPDLRAFVEQNERLKSFVVAGADDESGINVVRQRVVSNLEFAIYRRRSPRMGAQPLQYNFAREFPLHNPFLTRYFHVYRSSVRELLRTFERRNGVRLWCSIRRSGKTTACLDLGTTTGDSVIVSQTCETTGQIPEGSLFYDSVCDALTNGKQIGSTYFADLVGKAAGERASTEGRVVFVLDEYETLFGRLKSAVGREPDLRYTVAQPLLNQMVAFTRENLLVFLGQQPNAHFILMDQNQLSAYVEQDPFPLFGHEEGTAQGELSELVGKVLTDRVSVDPSFVDGIHDETAGHPYLTVNLLVEFVDWLIEKHRPVSSLQLDGDDFGKFSKQKLRPKNVSLSPEYRFFREAISEALSSEARATTPWLHGIYTCIRGVVRSSSETFRCRRDDFESIVERAQLEEIGMHADLLLTTGSQANFLDYNEREVWPKIRLLARLAAVTRGRVAA